MLIFKVLDDDRRDREASGLVRTGRIFGGLIDDIKRKYTFNFWQLPNSNRQQYINKFSGKEETLHLRLQRRSSSPVHIFLPLPLHCQPSPHHCLWGPLRQDDPQADCHDRGPGCRPSIRGSFLTLCRSASQPVGLNGPCLRL